MLAAMKKFFETFEDFTKAARQTALALNALDAALLPVKELLKKGKLK